LIKVDQGHSFARGLEVVESLLGHRFSDPELLKLALSHSSTGGPDNERLEFLGDRVLGLIIAEKLHTEFPKESEGGLAVRLNALVRRETCAKVAAEAGLAPHLIMAASESASGGRAKAAILAGACEAVIAALYLDGGMNAAKKFVLDHWESAFKSLAAELRDAKTTLQEWAQSGARKQKNIPAYVAATRQGPDHAPLFTVEVFIAGIEPEKGQGPTKRDAEQDAARRMLRRLGVWKE
jgi:ribonuclease-3